MLYIAAARLPLYIVIKHLIGTRRVQEASPPPLPALYTRSHFMDVNIRLTIEPAAFFNVSLLPDSNKITSRSSKTVRTHSLSPSRGLSRRKTRDDREPRVTTARITRAPADRKLPLIATQTFILHPEHPRLSLSLSMSFD